MLFLTVPPYQSILTAVKYYANMPFPFSSSTGTHHKGLYVKKKKTRKGRKTTTAVAHNSVFVYTHQMALFTQLLFAPLQRKVGFIYASYLHI